jgi:hypothetical protein
MWPVILIWMIWCSVIGVTLGRGNLCRAASDAPAAASSRLIALAAQRFPHLTAAERAMLWFSDIDNGDRGEFAAAGTVVVPGDPSNDPAQADKWGASREIRAALIRWMCVDHQAQGLVDPAGIRVLGARIVGVLNLALVSVPIPIVLDNCVLIEPIKLGGTEIPYLELDGSYTREIHASGLHVRNNLSMGKGFHAVGGIFLDHAKIGLDLDFGGARLRYAKNPEARFLDQLRVTLFAYLIQVGGNVWLNRGFESDGAVDLGGAKIGGNLHFDSGRFINPGNVAIAVPGASVDGVIFLSNFGPGDEVEVDGVANFSSDRVGDSFIVDHVKFDGSVGDQHGFDGAGMTVARSFIWHHVTLKNDAQLDLSDAAVGVLLDDEESWPAPGRLLIDGLTYSGLSAGNGGRVEPPGQKARGAGDAVESRLRWLALQPPGFHSEPYNELAKYYMGSGEEASAVTVFIAQEDDRYTRLGLWGRIWGGFLKATIGYGRRPLLAFNWSIFVVLIGWAAVLMGKRAGVMRLTWPENLPPQSNDHVASLHPLLYSLDVFLPFVDLHQEHYWWPDEAANGECEIAGRRVLIRGSHLRIYLWVQIIAGWLLSAIFVAGVTGLIRSD